MSPVAIAVIFVIVWWMIFFMVLPFGAKAPEKAEAGHDAGAPERPRIGLKALIAALISAAITGVVVLAVDFDLVNFRGILQ